MVVVARGDIGQGIRPWSPWGLGPSKFLPGQPDTWRRDLTGSRAAASSHDSDWEFYRELDETEDDENPNKPQRIGWSGLLGEVLRSRHSQYHHSYDDEDDTQCVPSGDGPSTSSQQYWLRGLRLTLQDRQELIDGDMLSDKHIFAAQKLLSEQFEDVQGFQDTCLSQTQFEPVFEDGSVQVHHTRGNHWVVSSWNKGSVVDIYDTLYDYPAPDLLRQLEQIYVDAPRGSDGRILYNMCDVQQQEGASDCGLFVIAIAFELCQGEDPCTTYFEQSRMRRHLYKCFENNHIMSFRFWR